MLDSLNKARPKLLAIAGSPRRNGNTDRLLNEVVAGAAAQGAQVKQVVLADLDISPCRHCDGCIQTGGICSIADDMQLLYQDLRDYDKFIFSSPVFFMGIPAHAKAMIDRCQALWVIKYLLKQPIATRKDSLRKGAFISAAGRNYKNLFDGCTATVKSWFITLDIEYTSDLLLPGMDKFDTVCGLPDKLRSAYTLGQNLIAN